MAWWEYPSNYSSGLEVNSTGTLMHYMNYASGGHLGLMLLIIVGVVSFLSLKVSFSSIKAMNAASIILFFVSIPMAMIGILVWKMVALMGVFAIITTMMMRSDSQVGL